MKIYISLIAIVLLFSKCRECSNDENQGEKALIPIQFEDFSLQEINEFDAIRIERTTLKRDTFKLTQLLIAYSAYSYSTQITDRAYKSDFGNYGSYLNNSDLILKWRYGSDTLSNIVIKKSKADVDKCHKDDPNVRVDQLNFTYKGKLIGKNEPIIVQKS